MPRTVPSLLQIPTLLLLLTGLAGPLPAQTLPIKTVATPVGEQFLFLPSSNLGMGGLHVATNDPLGDPFTNPAVRGEGPFLISLSPTLYGDKRGTVQGRSLPLSAALSGAHWFGTMAVAVQRLDDDPKEVFSLPSELNELADEDVHGRNTYFLGSIGRQLGSRTALGLKVAYGELGLLDGNRRLYPAALSVLQEGHVRTVTVGGVHGFGDQHLLRVTLSHSDFSMTNEVTGWRTVSDGSPGSWAVPEVWNRTDASHSEVWEGRVRYTLSIPSERVRLTALASLQNRDQDRTPQYDLVHIPRDPGSSTIGEIGFGWEAVGPLFRLAVEGVFSPGSAQTQLFSDSIVQGTGGTIQPGDPTLDSDYRFKNWRVAGGADVPIGRGGIQLGLGINGYNFHLEQRDLVRGEDHDRDASWNEWVPSVGGRMVLGPAEVRYSLHLVNRGTSPCDGYSYRTSCRNISVPYHFTGLRVAPTEPEELPDFRMMSHQLMVTMPWG